MWNAPKVANALFKPLSRRLSFATKSAPRSVLLIGFSWQHGGCHDMFERFQGRTVVWVILTALRAALVLNDVFLHDAY